MCVNPQWNLYLIRPVVSQSLSISVFVCVWCSVCVYVFVCVLGGGASWQEAHLAPVYSSLPPACHETNHRKSWELTCRDAPPCPFWLCSVFFYSGPPFPSASLPTCPRHIHLSLTPSTSIHPINNLEPDPWHSALGAASLFCKSVICWASLGARPRYFTLPIVQYKNNFNNSRKWQLKYKFYEN